MKYIWVIYFYFMLPSLSRIFVRSTHKVSNYVKYNIGKKLDLNFDSQIFIKLCVENEILTSFMGIIHHCRVGGTENIPCRFERK